MAGQSDLLNRLRPQLLQLDDDALASLASVGLLRRARKSLEALAPTVMSSADAITVDLGPQQVRFDARGPSHAHCTCPAKSTCQHVLSAWLYLRAVAEKSGAPAQPSASTDLLGELLAITPSALIEYAGLPAVREAMDSLEGTQEPHVTPGPPVLIRLLQPPVEMRYAGGGLDAIIFDYRGKRRERLITQAILALQRASGRAPPDLPRRAARQAGTKQFEPPTVLLERVCATFLECVDIGIAHLSENVVERLLSHAAAAEGAGLHRLSLTLNRLGTHVDLQLGRSALTSTQELLDQLAQAFALASSIRQANCVIPALWGTARASFDAVSHLDLIGVAAEPWRTSSGYTGLTLLLWSPAQERWLSATEARPVGFLGFDPIARYRASGPWPGLESPATACGAQIRLTGASVSAFGRLSLSERTRATVSSLAQWPHFGASEYSDWESLRAHSRDEPSGAGLVEPDPHAAYVVLRPSAWSPPTFNPTTQELSRTLLDYKREELALVIPYSRINAHGIDRLEALKPSKGSRVLAKLSRSQRGIVARPVALLSDQATAVADNLLLDPMPSGSVLDPLARKLKTLVDAATSEANEVYPTSPPNATDARLRALERELLSVAERGASGSDARGLALQRLTESVRSTGIELPVLRRSSTQSLAEYVLRLRYCVSLVRALA